MQHKKLQNTIGILFLFVFVSMIPACSQLTATQTGDVTLNINAREADSAAQALDLIASTKKLTVTVQGDYKTSKTVDFSDKAQVTFKKIPVGAKISVQADLFINNEKAYTGTSNSFVVKSRKNSVSLVLKRIQAEDLEVPEPDKGNILHVDSVLGNDTAKGLTKPLKTIQGAIARIKEFNDSTEDYVIEVTGSTDEYEIVIDETVPANSITLKGAAQETTENQEQQHNGIARNSRPSDGASVLRISGPISVTITNFEFNVETYGIEGDGAVINVGNGATVTLEDGALLAGKGSVVQSGQDQTTEISSNGVVAVENGGLLMMKRGSTICNFQIKRGAVYVKNGGTFIMAGGTIAGISTFGSGGGAFVSSKGSFRMSGGDITGNSATTSGGGVCLEASGKDVASFSMTGGAISRNSAQTSGSGIGFLGTPAEDCAGTITLGGSAVIGSNNDIYLPDYMRIDVESELTAAVDDDTTPTITPASYTRITPLFTDETLQNDELKEQVVKFDVTVDGDTGTTYVLAANGYMAKEEPQIVVNITFASSYQDINVVVTAGGQTITGSDPISGNQIITFTADEGYSAYRWTLDDTVISSTRQCSIDTSANSVLDWSVGTYDLKLEAYSKAGDSLFYSYNAQIEISAN